VIVLILGLPFAAGAAQQVEIVNPDNVVSSGDWVPALVDYENLNDWDADPDASFASAFDQGSRLMVDLEDPAGGPYSAIKVKLRARSVYVQTDLNVWIYAGGALIGSEWYFSVPVSGSFAEYSYEWTGLNMTAAELADLQVEIVIYYWQDQIDISAVQVELISEGGGGPIPTDPIDVEIDYRPHRSANPLNYRSRGNVQVAIFGFADFDVRQIDPESVRLAGVAPVRGDLWIGKNYSRTEEARDEYEDVILMFKNQQLIEALEKSLGRELENGEEVVLDLTGNLKDDNATPIKGDDTAVVFGKHHKHEKEGNWKNYWKWWK
jgi:hypothetical protein